MKQQEKIDNNNFNFWESNIKDMYDEFGYSKMTIDGK
jgi:hypothetical protein